MIVMPKIIEVKALGPYKLHLQYSNGDQGEVDLSDMSGKGVFKKWETAGYFQKVFIPKDHLAVAWDEELELCPNALYLEMVGKNYEEYAANK
jgi:hypothetical protein